MFADALTRSWKQVIKFKPAAGAGAAAEPRSPRQRGLRGGRVAGRHVAGDGRVARGRIVRIRRAGRCAARSPRASCAMSAVCASSAKPRTSRAARMPEVDAQPAAPADEPQFGFDNSRRLDRPEPLLWFGLGGHADAARPIRRRSSRSRGWAGAHPRCRVRRLGWPDPQPRIVRRRGGSCWSFVRSADAAFHRDRSE